MKTLFTDSFDHTTINFEFMEDDSATEETSGTVNEEKKIGFHQIHVGPYIIS